MLFKAKSVDPKTYSSLSPKAIPQYLIAHPYRACFLHHIHNVRDFPQAKLDNSEINALFLLHKHGGLYFLLDIILV